MTQTQSAPTRQEFGHTWEWVDATDIVRGHFKNTSGKETLIFPPSGGHTDWKIRVIDPANRDYKWTSLTGEAAELRAFSAAERFTRQQ